MATHKCPGPGCTLEVERAKLACRRHWYQVPVNLRLDVYDTWDHGLGAGSEEHTAAIDAAIKTMTP